MKWDWRFYVGGMIDLFGEYVQGACEFTGVMLSKDHDFRCEQQEFAMAVAQTIEELPGGDDTNWGGTGEDDNQGGGK